MVIIQNENFEILTENEQNCCSLLRTCLTNKTSLDDIQTLAEIAFKDHKGATQTDTYVGVCFIVPTTSGAEPLLSECRQVFINYLQRISPTITLEA